jgi:hypothetical protein
MPVRYCSTQSPEKPTRPVRPKLRAVASEPDRLRTIFSSITRTELTELARLLARRTAREFECDLGRAGQPEQDDV